MVDPAKKPEAKAIAAPVGGGLGGVLTVFTLWLIGVYVWDAPSDAAHATGAIAAVPLPVSGLITAVVPAAFALAAAYWAPHTHRPDLATEVQPHLDERLATPLEHIDATLTEMHADAQSKQWPDPQPTDIDQMRDDLHHGQLYGTPAPVPSPDMGLRIMDEAHD